MLTSAIRRAAALFMDSEYYDQVVKPLCHVAGASIFYLCFTLARRRQTALPLMQPWGRPSRACWSMSGFVRSQTLTNINIRPAFSTRPALVREPGAGHQCQVLTSPRGLVCIASSGKSLSCAARVFGSRAWKYQGCSTVGSKSPILPSLIPALNCSAAKLRPPVYATLLFPKLYGAGMDGVQLWT